MEPLEAAWWGGEGDRRAFITTVPLVSPLQKPFDEALAR
jgi:hypothetical protein